MSQVNGTSKIDAVKEILFGQNMKEYDQRFSGLEALFLENLSNQSEAIEKRITLLEARYDSNISELKAELKKMEKLIVKKNLQLENSKVDKKHLKKFLLQLADSL